jgi:hypothetical protein
MNYSEYTLKELIDFCKKNEIKGYSSKTKEYIVKKLNDIDIAKSKCIENNREKLENISKIDNKKLDNSLYSYLLANYSELINQYYGSIDEMKCIAKGTMNKYLWKCKNYETCNKTFECRPRDLYRCDKRQTKYCNICRRIEGGKSYQKYMLTKNGSILDKYPNIINVWSDNNIYKPEQLTRQSHKIVKLKCIKNPSHLEYDIAVYNIQETNCISCPKCYIATSKTEIRIYSEIVPLFKEVYWQKKINSREADILIEDIKLIIEIDGYPWHYNKNDKDLEKNKLFNENGYRVLRIRDTKLLPINSDNLICEISKFTFYDFNKIIEWINSNYNYNLLNIDSFTNDTIYNSILYNIYNIKYDDSIEYQFPESIKIWDYDKNKPFLPSQFTMGSHTEIWIKCSNNHSFKRPIKQIFRIRVKDKSKKIIECPDCSNKIKKNKRPISINGVNYKSIQECCKNLNISKNSLYTNIKNKKLDVNDIDIISQNIAEIYNKKLNSS